MSRGRRRAAASAASRPASALKLTSSTCSCGHSASSRSGATGGQGLLGPELAGVCPGCQGNLAPYAGIGGPRRWCEACRPPRRHNPRQTPRAGDRVQIDGAELLVVGRARLPLGGRRWRGGVEVRRPDGLVVVIPLADWRASPQLTAQRGVSETSDA